MGRDIFAVMDIGSYEIKFVVTEIVDDRQYILDAFTVPSRGIKKATVVDTEKLKEDILKAIKISERFIGKKVKSVIIGLPSINSVCKSVTGTVSVTDKVTGEDIKQVFKKIFTEETTKFYRSSKDKDISTIVPVNFILDDNKPIYYPIGHKTTKLNLSANVVTVDRKLLLTIVKVFSEINIDVFDIVSNAVGLSYSMFADEDINKTVCIVDLGSDTTTISVFDKGVLRNSEAFLIGCNTINKEISKEIGCSLEHAEEIKKIYGNLEQDKTIKEIIMTYEKEGKEKVFTSDDLTRIMNRKYRDLMKLVKTFLSEINARNLAETCIFVGGGARVSGLDKLVVEIFGENSFVRLPIDVGVKHSKFSSAVGVSNFIYILERLYEQHYNVYDGYLSESNSDIDASGEGIVYSEVQEFTADNVEEEFEKNIKKNRSEKIFDISFEE